MTRFFSFLLVLVLCLTMAGCGSGQERVIAPVAFYYPYAEMPFGSDEGIIVPEIRESSGHRDNLPYLLALYQMGPSSDELHSPLPSGVRIQAVERNGQRINLTLGDQNGVMTDTRFTIASACLAMTCLELTEAKTIVVTCGSRVSSMNRDNLVFQDTVKTPATEETS